MNLNDLFFLNFSGFRFLLPEVQNFRYFFYIKIFL